MPAATYRILIVDDSASDRKVYRRFLERQDEFRVEVHEVATAAEALRDCPRLAPDCVILDYRLPDLDGLTMMPKLQEICRAPVIFITGQPQALVVTEAYRQGAVKYLSKDVLSSRTLQRAVKEVLDIESSLGEM